MTGARQPFPGNRIPANRINPVGANIVKYLPLPKRQPAVDNGSPNYVAQNTPNNLGQQLGGQSRSPFQQQRRVERRLRLSIHGRTSRQLLPRRAVCSRRSEQPAGPCRRAEQHVRLEFIDRPHAPRGVQHVRRHHSAAFAVRHPHPRLQFLLCRRHSRTAVSGGEPDRIPGHQLYGAWQHSLLFYGTNGTLTKLAGEHSLKIGADYRRLGVRSKTYGNSAGSFTFSGQFTGSNATSPAALRATRSPICSSAIRRPATCRSIRRSTISSTTRAPMSRTTIGPLAVDLELRVRLEHETGLAERTTTSPSDSIRTR